jgi:hypothetical protein
VPERVYPGKVMSRGLQLDSGLVYLTPAPRANFRAGDEDNAGRPTPSLHRPIQNTELTAVSTKAEFLRLFPEAGERRERETAQRVSSTAARLLVSAARDLLHVPEGEVRCVGPGDAGCEGRGGGVETDGEGGEREGEETEVARREAKTVPSTGVQTGKKGKKKMVIKCKTRMRRDTHLRH